VNARGAGRARNPSRGAIGGAAILLTLVSLAAFFGSPHPAPRRSRARPGDRPAHRRRLGFDVFLAKPLEPGRLVATIGHLLAAS